MFNKRSLSPNSFSMVKLRALTTSSKLNYMQFLGYPKPFSSSFSSSNYDSTLFCSTTLIQPTLSPNSLSFNNFICSFLTLASIFFLQSPVVYHWTYFFTSSLIFCSISSSSMLLSSFIRVDNQLSASSLHQIIISGVHKSSMDFMSSLYDLLALKSL